MDTNTTQPQRRGNEYAFIVKIVLISVITTLAVLWLLITYLPKDMLPSAAVGLRQTAAENSVPSIITEYPSAIPDMIERVSPAVVSVIVTADVPIIERYYEEYDPFGRFFGFTIPQERQIGTEERQIGGGSGFFVSPDGYIVTNSHVVAAEEADYSIVTNDGESFDVTVIAKDPTLDIAILKVDDERPFPYLEFGDSDSVRLGSTVIAIGNALAEFPNSVSVGVVSGLSRDIVAGDRFGELESLEGVIQTDAAINQGNSGGPLLNIDGEVIGINVAMAGNSENIGFALPARPVKSAYESIEEHGEIIRPFMGVSYVTITEEIAKQNDLSVDYGVIIVRGGAQNQPAVIPGSAADKAGIEENDIILEFDGVRLDDSRSFAGLIREKKVGDTVTLKVLHDGEEREVTVTLEKAPTK